MACITGHVCLCYALAAQIEIWGWTVLSLFCSAPKNAAMTCDRLNRGNGGWAARSRYGFRSFVLRTILIVVWMFNNDVEKQKGEIRET